MTNPFTQLFTSTDPLIQILFNVLRGLFILAIAILIARGIKFWIIRVLSRSKVSLNVSTLLGNLARVGVVALGVILMLPSFGVDWAGLLTLLGAAGLAVSLALQDVLKNVVAGIYILIEQPFKIGDRITVKDSTGVVQGIELRTTILQTDDHLQIVIPNSVIMTEVLTNRSASDLQRQTIIIRLKPGDMAEISREINEALKSVEQVATTPTPTVALEEIRNEIARLRVQFWAPTTEKADVTAQVIGALQSRFPEAGVTAI